MSRFSSLFYTIVVFVLVLGIFFMQPPQVSDFMESLTCVPCVEMEHGELVVGEHLPNFVLNWGSGQRSFTEIIPLDAGFHDKPQITVSITGIDCPINPPRIDVDVIDGGPYEFTVRVSTWDDTIIRAVRLQWLAVEAQCTDEKISQSLLSPLFGTGSGHSPGWDLNSQYIGERSYSLEQNLQSTLSGSPYTHLSLAGVDFGQSRSNALAFWAWDVAPSGFSSTISTWDDGRLDSIRISSISLVLNHLNNIFYEAGTITLSTESVPHWRLNVPSDMYQTFETDISFDTNFLRIPWMFLSISAFDTGNTPLKISVFVKETTFDHCTIVVKTESMVSLKSIDINYFAYDVREVFFTLVDTLLFVAFVICVIVALTWEVADRKKVAGYLQDPEVFSKGKVAKGTLKEDDQDPPEKISEEMGGKEKLKEMMEQIHKKGDENFLTENDDYDDLKLKSKYQKSIEEGEAEWVGLLRSFEDSSKVSGKTKRSKAETSFLIICGFLFVTGLVWFFKDYILANKWFHQLDSMSLAVIILGLEYFLLGAAILTQPWPSVRELPRNHKHVAILIASHASAGQHPDAIANSAKDNIMGTSKLTKENLLKIQQNKEAGFEKTLKMASTIVPDGQVFVCHNSRGYNPSAGDRTIDVISKVQTWGRKVNYVYLPVGNKTLSLLWTAKYWVPNHIDTVVIMDDDIIIPFDMSFQTNKLKNKNVAGAVPVIRTAKNKEGDGLGKRSMLVWMQDFEYLLAGFAKMFQSSCGTANYPHGAVSIWNRDVMVEVLERHNTVFDGEDAQMGLILREMTMEGNGMKSLVTIGNTPVLTSVPEDLCHPGEDFLGDVSIDEKSLLAQRIKSWDVTAHRFLFKYLKHLFFYWNPSTLLLKLYYLHEILTIVQDYLRILVIIYFVYLNDLASLGITFDCDCSVSSLSIVIASVQSCCSVLQSFENVPRKKNFDRLVDDPSRLPPYHPVLKSLIKRNRDWHRIWNPSEFAVDDDQHVTRLHDSADDTYSSEVSVTVGTGLTDSEESDFASSPMYVPASVTSPAVTATSPSSRVFSDMESIESRSESKSIRTGSGVVKRRKKNK
ncbi:hypothetical protein GEMRC1_011643 [Eukaryota sp. GEM-RC1]